MRRTVIVGIAAVASVAALAGAAAAATGRWHRDPDRAYRFITRKVDRMMNEINATDAQRAQINQIKERLFKEGQDLRQKQRDLRRELLADWDAAQVNGADVHAKVNAQLDAFRAFANDVADASIQVHDLLTPEQRAQVKQAMSRHAEHRHHGQDAEEE